jgi:hypothetical protein
MKSIKLVDLEKYNDPAKFEKVKEGIYKALYHYENNIVVSGNYVTTLSFTLEVKFKETKNRQYPLEDILDKFLAHVSEYIQNEEDNPIMIVELCTQNWLDNMEELVQIVGKHVYYKKVLKEGKPYIELVIEDEKTK